MVAMFFIFFYSPGIFDLGLDRALLFKSVLLYLFDFIVSRQRQERTAVVVLPLCIINQLRAPGAPGPAAQTTRCRASQPASRGHALPAAVRRRHAADAAGGCRRAPRPGHPSVSGPRKQYALLLLTVRFLSGSRVLCAVLLLTAVGCPFLFCSSASMTARGQSAGRAGAV